jgi:hypothetical protein
MPPVVLALATVTGAIVTARFLKKEWQRVNSELDRAEKVRTEKPVTLKRDPVTGVWHPK